MAYGLRPPIVGIMVGMLMVAGFNRGGKFRHRLFGRAFIRDFAEITIPRHAAFAAELRAGRKSGRIVERPRGDVQILAGRIMIKQRRSALGAKSARDRGRTGTVVGTLGQPVSPDCPRRAGCRPDRP